MSKNPPIATSALFQDIFNDALDNPATALVPFLRCFKTKPGNWSNLVVATLGEGVGLVNFKILLAPKSVV